MIELATSNEFAHVSIKISFSFLHCVSAVALICNRSAYWPSPSCNITEPNKTAIRPAIAKRLLYTLSQAICFPKVLAAAKKDCIPGFCPS